MLAGSKSVPIRSARVFKITIGYLWYFMNLFYVNFYVLRFVSVRVCVAQRVADDLE